MKRWKLMVVLGVMVFAFVGCGKTETEIIKPVENVPEVESVAENEPMESEVEEKNDNYVDLEEKGAEGELTAFAEQIQTAVAAKDIEALADLCFYPLAVNGEVVDSKEAFIELGADVIFTEERCAVIEAVDVSILEETMAGVAMGDAVPNIIFKSVDGKLGITGIN